MPLPLFELLSYVHFVPMESMHYWRKATCFFNILALKEFVSRKAEDGEISWEDRHWRECSLFEDGSGPGEERWSSVDVVGSQVDAMPMAWPFSVFRDWESNFSSPFS